MAIFQGGNTQLIKPGDELHMSTMSCKFCKGVPKRAEYVGDGIKTMGMMLEMMLGADEETPHSNYIYIKDGNLLTWDNSAKEYAELSTEIKYCPMCGRKLQSNTIEPQIESR